MTSKTAPAPKMQTLSMGRVLRLMAFIVLTAVLIEIWNYAIGLQIPTLGVSGLGFMVGSLLFYYGPKRGLAQGKDWVIMAAIGLATGWVTNLAWVAYQSWT